MSTLKSAGAAAGGLLVLILALGGGLYLRGQSVAHPSIEVAPRLSSISPDSGLRARGRHLSHIMGCRHCHGSDLGGRVVGNDPPLRLVAPNLTDGTGGVGGRYTTADWARAIRHGLDPTGEPLIGMPAPSYHDLSDHDLRALIAHLRQIPPVDRSLPSTTIRPLGYLLMGTGRIDPVANVVPSRRHPDHVPVAASVEHGRYLYDAACRHCHGPDLQGGSHPDPNGAPVPSLEPVQDWSYAATRRAITQGVTPRGALLDDTWMPWSAFEHLTEAETRALYRFLRHRAAPRPGTASRRGASDAGRPVRRRRAP